MGSQPEPVVQHVSRHRCFYDWLRQLNAISASLCCRHGTPTATGGVRIALGKAPAAVSTSTFLPLGWETFLQISLGDQLSALGNDTTTGTLNVTELPT